MALEKFRSGALSPALRDAASSILTIMKERQNKYLSPLLFDNETHFICFSPAEVGVNSAEKFSAIVSPALIFSFEPKAHQPPAEVLSGACPDPVGISRQKKERVHSAVFPSNNKRNCLCHPRKAGISAFGSTLWRIGGLS